jgi:hypothetical protein
LVEQVVQTGQRLPDTGAGTRAHRRPEVLHGDPRYICASCQPCLTGASIDLTQQLIIERQ